MGNNDNLDNLDNKDNKRSKRTRKVDGDGGHKKPWREEYATPGEIKAFLSDHVYLRYNTVQYRSHGRRGYRVVTYKPEEIEMNRRTLAYDARSESEAIASDSEEGDRGDT